MSEVDGGGESSGGEGGSDLPGMPGSGGLSEIAQEILAEDESAGSESEGEESEESHDQTAEEDEPLAAKSEPKEAKPKDAKTKTFTVKANGKVYNFDSEEKLIAAAGRGIAVQQKSQEERTELATMKREVESMRDTLRQQAQYVQSQREMMEKSPEEFLRKLGPRAEEIAEKLLLDKATEWQRTQDMTPRERELYQREKVAAEKLAQYEKAGKEREATEHERAVEQQKEQISALFGAALKEYNLPTNTTTIRVMANVMRSAANKGVQLTKEQAAQLTRTQLQQIGKDSFGTMKAEDFVKEHPELSEAVRKHFVAQARGGAPVAAPAAKRAPSGQFKPKATEDAWERELEQLKRQGSVENKKNGLYLPYNSK